MPARLAAPAALRRLRPRSSLAPARRRSSCRQLHAEAAPRAAALGGVAGFGTGLLGWGAAQLVVPGLASASIGGSALAAAGGSSVALCGIATVSAVKLGSDGAVDLALAAAVGVPAMLMAPLGARAAARVASSTLTTGFNALTLVLVPLQAHVMLARIRGHDTAPGADEGAKQRSGGPAQHSGFGTVLGFGCGVLGVGGLPFIITYLTAATDASHATIIGTTFAAAAPTVAASALSHIAAGHVPRALLLPLVGSAAAGACAGSSLALHVPDHVLQTMFVASLGAAGVRAGLALRLAVRGG